ncbi:ArsR/SmtB family transcription factor [Syntrophomonas palmitatica]|uniref:ArsR/SmtB family transcription factor n=1 Tax=Syntrophomonas palmitatica TaxID=402877 RepID=UPI0006D1E04D|nr:metalloregulator ArsR/SmtB family transcription factor [Syntrophomonas palmitatica]
MFETVFKALGEPTRLKIIKLLAERELCVCDLEEVMQISQPRVSQHLKVLKHAGLVNERKEGQRTICSLNRDLLNQTISQFQEYISKPLELIPELAGELSRMPVIDGEACIKKSCSTTLVGSK